MYITFKQKQTLHWGRTMNLPKYQIIKYIVYVTTLLILPLIGTSNAEQFAIAHGLERRITIEGETLGAANIKEIEGKIYIYSNNSGEIRIYSQTGDYAGSIHPESIGRRGYRGDDFTIIKDHLYFLNSVDSRIEEFQLPDGKHMGSHSISDTIFHAENLREQLPLTIRAEAGELLIGNLCSEVPFFNPTRSVHKRTLPIDYKNRTTSANHIYTLTPDSLIIRSK